MFENVNIETLTRGILTCFGSHNLDAQNAQLFSQQPEYISSISLKSSSEK